jgi:ankyrin repeat protein
MLLKQKGVDANSRDTEYGRSPLSWAAANDHIATFEQLVARKGIDSNALDNQQWSALH